MSTNKEYILVAGIVDDRGEVSVCFASMMMRMQQHLVTTPNAPKIIFEFFLSTRDALKHAEANDAITHAVIVHGDMGLINLDFLFNQYDDDICLAAYPLRCVDWNKVYDLKKQGVTDADILERESYKYNFEASEDVQINQDKTIRLDNDESHQAKVVKLARAAFNEFGRKYNEATHTYKGPCSIDVSTRVVNSGPYDFVGTVMTSLIMAH